MVMLVLQELPVPSKMFPAQKAQLVHQVQMVNPDLLAHLAQMDNPVKLDLMVHQVMLVQMVPQVLPVETEMPELMVKLVQEENVHTVPHHVPLPVIKPFNYHHMEADVLVKAWLPLVESTTSLFSLFYIMVIAFFGEAKNRLDLGSQVSS